jgi:elongator complex protein 3
VQRDIPSPLIVAGVKKSNLRQLAKKRMEDRGSRCLCIRCREAGLRRVVQAEPRLLHESYVASGGIEHFLSFESEDDVLVGFLRLRLGSSARVRELHIYGPMVPIGSRKDGWQHRGYGARLMEEAERLTLEAGYPLIEVTSGIGARGYYRRREYDLCPPYMVKRLR